MLHNIGDRNMKLAEALSIRKDLQMRIEQLRERLTNNVRVQEGEMPYEQPEELMKELDSCLNQWQKWIYNINVTNMRTIYDGKTLTQFQAEREVLRKRVSILRSAFDTASQPVGRYSRQEIKSVTVIDVKALRKEVDKLSQQLRKLDVTIQTINFTTELIE